MDSQLARTAYSLLRGWRTKVPSCGCENLKTDKIAMSPIRVCLLKSNAITEKTRINWPKSNAQLLFFYISVNQCQKSLKPEPHATLQAQSNKLCCVPISRNVKLSVSLVQPITDRAIVCLIVGGQSWISSSILKLAAVERLYAPLV